MKLPSSVSARLAAVLLLTSSSIAANADVNQSDSSRVILPSNFRPPQVFKNVNLVRSISLEKGYPRETINVVIANIGSSPQDEYYLPFEDTIIGNVGGLEVKDKNKADQAPFKTETVEYDLSSSTQFYRIHLPQPLKPSEQQTLSISYSLLSSVGPLPKAIGQTDKQYLVHKFSAYTPSAYVTEKQKTNLKFSNTDVPDYTKIPGTNSENKEDPVVQGNSFTYGPFGEVPAGVEERVSVRYEFTKPVNHVSLLERDVEVSHWGGNLAVEERYWLENRGAELKEQFSRVKWVQSAYFSPASSALKELVLPLRPDAVDPYVTDDIGNVSTTHFRPPGRASSRGARLELKPRYPVFGGWKYKFRVGWNQDLGSSLRISSSGSGSYVLRVPFIEGPKQYEGIEYKKVNVRVILPEGAKNIRFDTQVPLLSSAVSTHRTFMDTKGRTTLELSAMNLIDELRERDLIVAYDYSAFAGYRKPVTVLLGVLGIFTAAWLLGNVDTSIGKGAKKS